MHRSLNFGSPKKEMSLSCSSRRSQRVETKAGCLATNSDNAATSMRTAVPVVQSK